MKRLLSILGSIGLVATAATAVVSCSSKKADAIQNPDGITVAPQAIWSSPIIIELDGEHFDTVKWTKDNFIVEQSITQDNGIVVPRQITIKDIGVSSTNIIITLATPMKEPSNKTPKVEINIYFDVKGTPTPNKKGNNDTYYRPVIEKDKN